MKLYFILVSLLFVASAHASDRKVGNVIAVEREVSDIYSTCLKNGPENTTKPQSFFSCAIKYTTDGELPVSKGRVIKLVDDKCSVVGETANGTLLITFAAAKSPSTFEASRSCLERALSTKDYVKVIVYTLE